MRIVPILTAALVTGFLYLAVFERDTLLAFSRGEDVPAQDETAQTAAAPEAAPAAVAQAQAARRVGVVVQVSKAEAIDNAVILRGLTRADRQVEVRAETSSTVVSEPLRKGTHVEAGEVLCELDPGTRQDALAEARAALSLAQSRMPEARARLIEAEARLEEARINDTVAQRLNEGGFASDTRVASTTAAVRAAEAGVATAEVGLENARSGIQSAQAAVAAAEREIARLTLRAPFSGLLESDTAELGSLLQPGGLCGTVIRLDPIKLVGYVPETQVGQVEIGARAGARLATGQQIAGEVVFIARSADPETRTFAVEIEVPNPDLAIRDGQTAEILVAAEGTRAHRLPQSALTLNEEGQLGVRSVGAGDIVEFLPVTLLRDNADGVWVGGLPETVDVIVVGQDFVTEGVAVAPSYREAAQ
ncbi:MAG TPA: efflux RND transporter periplasmic adaptor subunit [Rhodobacteraceae bacterium]|nr:efflux RND transporter periplasmic adaptor subunit [Paracoccaceae bacterium]